MSLGDNAVSVYRQKMSVAIMEASIALAGIALSVLLFQVDIIDLKWQVGGIAICGVLAVASLSKLVRRRPQLVATARGITVPHYGHISWGEISHLGLDRATPASAPRRLDIFLCDSRYTLSRVPRLVRWCLHPAADRPRYDVIDVHLFGIPEPAAEIVAALRLHHPGLQARGEGSAPQE